MASGLLTFEELSSYEQDRMPHEIIEDTNVLMHSDALRQEFTCVICLEILKKTLTSQRCLHRFCYNCITTSLRLGNKECPTCRAKLTSKRDLRADLVFDGLIVTLFPKEVQHQREQEDKKLPPNIRTYSTSPGQSSNEINGNRKSLNGYENNSTKKKIAAKGQKSSGDDSVEQHQEPKINHNIEVENQRILRSKKDKNNDDNKSNNTKPKCTTQKRRGRGECTRKSTRQ